jgi:multiple sugar transport system permease protein
MALFVTFNLYPMVNAIVYSFFRYDMLTPAVFVGLSNYREILTDPLFQKSVAATVAYLALGGPTVWLIGFGLALLLEHPFRRRDTFRAILFIPAVISVVPASIVWKVLLQPYGPINGLLGVTINWLTDSRTAMLGIVLMSVWRGIGFYMVLFLVGLQAIPAQYHEAAAIDGAGWWSRFRYITLPLMRPTLAFVVIITLITGLQQFVPMFVMTRGGPNDSTMVLTLRIFETGFNFFQMGRAMAMSVVMFLCILLFTLLQLRLFRTDEEKGLV